MQTSTCGAEINILNMPIAEPSVPSLIYFESIAKGSARVDDQPIPAKPIAANTVTLLGMQAIKRYATAIDNNETACTLLFPSFSAIFAIGIAITKQIKLKNAKQIEEKFCASVCLFAKVAMMFSASCAVFGTSYNI